MARALVSAGARLLMSLLIALLCATRAFSAELQVNVVDQRGAPLSHAPVYLTAEDGATLPLNLPAAVARMDQRNETFQPFLVTIPQGAQLRFTNSDVVNHHVYSFSAAKKLDVVVPIGGDSEAFVFTRPGPVSLGCNIHDHMLAYIYVAPSPYFGTTDEEGRTVLRDVPPGRYRLHGWHPRKPGFETEAVAVELGAEGASGRLTLKVRPDRRRRAFDKRRY